MLFNLDQNNIYYCSKLVINNLPPVPARAGIYTTTATNEFESHSNFPNNPIHILQASSRSRLIFRAWKNLRVSGEKIYGLEGLSSMTRRESISNSSQNKCVALFIPIFSIVSKKTNFHTYNFLDSSEFWIDRKMNIIFNSNLPDYEILIKYK